MRYYIFILKTDNVVTPTTAFSIYKNEWLPVSVEVESQVELRNVVEDGESEGGEDKSEEEKESDASFVESLVLSHVRVVTRDVVTQPYGGEGDKHKVQSIQEGPVGLDDVEEESGEENGEK